MARSAYFGFPMYFPRFEAIFTSTGFTDAACTLISNWSGLEISGVGRVASSYSLGLQCRASATARIDRGILLAIVIYGIPALFERPSACFGLAVYLDGEGRGLRVTNSTALGDFQGYRRDLVRFRDSNVIEGSENELGCL
jgi:hypothetical protein